jgi:hypothetical protein
LKLALISGVHANLEALQATLADIASQSLDRIVCLGDIVACNATRRVHRADLARSMRCASPTIMIGLCAAQSEPKIAAIGPRGPFPGRAGVSAGTISLFSAACSSLSTSTTRSSPVYGALHPASGCERGRLDNDARRMLSFEALMAHPLGARIGAFGHNRERPPC